MASSPSYSDFKTAQDNNALLSPALAQASLEYMRSSSPESGEPYGSGNSFTKPGYATTHFSDSGSSPLLSCPPSWFLQEAQGEDDNVQSEIPLSSSPPDFTSSSPQSIGSKESEQGSSSVTSASSESLSDYVSTSQHNPSLVDFVPGPSAEGFGQQLHRLLLVAMKDREVKTSPGNSLVETSRSGSPVTRTSLENGSTVDRTHPATLSAGSPLGLVSKWFSGQDPQINAASKLAVVYESSTPPSCGPSPLLTIRETDEVSPIEFGSTQVLLKNAKEPGYRLIKRAQSYVPPRNLDSGSEPHPKRQRSDRPSGSHAHNRIYARRAASLRRADSLTTVAEESRIISSPSACAPTVPATPVPIKKKTSSKVLRSPVPIIAPPRDYVPKLPPSLETLAKTRLGRYLEREAEGRELDGLSLDITRSLPPSRAREVGDEHTFYPISESELYDSMTEWETVLGLGRKRRESVVNWLLEVLPPVFSDSNVSSPTPSTASSSSLWSQESCTTSTTESSVFVPKRIYNLLDQLQNSPDTRFHAVWMFLRFFYRTLSPASESLSRVKVANPVLSPMLRSVLAEDGLGLYLWDIAVACLSLSVKFHRDFLDPLLPVYAQEYVAIAPHALDLEDLENAHRDVLSALQYRLGVTPQLMMDELWRALPSLRTLLDFNEGWEIATKNAWLILFDALEEPDVLRFLISTLTIASLMDGIVESLVDRQCRREVLKARSKSPTAERKLNMQALRKKFTKIAEAEAEGVFCDFQALIGITDVQLCEMREWLTGLY